MSNVEQVLTSNAQYGLDFAHAHLAMPPSRSLAVVTCMDARIDVYSALGLNIGEAHIIRNAGGLTGEAIRSLMISQFALGTREVLVIGHTDCGMQTIAGGAGEQFLDNIERETGSRPDFDLGAFESVEDHVRAMVQTVLDSPFVPHKDVVRGFVYQVETGKLVEVLPEAQTKTLPSPRQSETMPQEVS